MRYTILALGSRGDVQPYVALGLGLRSAGHDVVIAATVDYAGLVAEHGLPFAPLAGRIADLMDRDLVCDALDKGRVNPLPLARRFLCAVAPLMSRLLADARAASESADALIVSTLARPLGNALAEARGGGLPVHATHFHPATPTGAHPHPFFPPLALLGPAYNRLTHVLGEHGFAQFLRLSLDAARRDVLGLPPLGPLGVTRRTAAWQRGPALYGYSAHVAPPPPDWDTRRHVVSGYWFLDRSAGWTPPPRLVNFLSAGPPPVYVGFGSVLAGRDPDQVSRLIACALGRAGQRGLLWRGWGDLGNIPLPDTILVLDEPVPHDWLFPRCAAVVHHGGAGTTAAALRAGAGSVIVPFFGDQRFWADRVHALGAGTPPIKRAELSEDRLVAAVERAVSDPVLRERARAVGGLLSAENGVARALAALAEDKTA